MDSKLQIISGTFRGRKLKIPPVARPTQNRARVALFNMISGFFYTDSSINVWDAFAGSGAFGIEILSRYKNANVVFTDSASESIKTIRENLSFLNIGSRATTKQIDTMSTIEKNIAKYDLIFVDPPYANNDFGTIFVKKWAKFGKTKSILIWEQDNENSIIPELSGIEILRDKTYGRARFTFFIHQ